MEYDVKIPRAVLQRFPCCVNGFWNAALLTVSRGGLCCSKCIYEYYYMGYYSVLDEYAGSRETLLSLLYYACPFCVGVAYVVLLVPRRAEM
jgi:hypothetical protein